MFYLLWIQDDSTPGRMYGPMSHDKALLTRQKFVMDDYEIDLKENLEDEWRPPNTTFEGWYIIQTTEMPCS